MTTQKHLYPLLILSTLLSAGGMPHHATHHMSLHHASKCHTPLSTSICRSGCLIGHNLKHMITQLWRSNEMDMWQLKYAGESLITNAFGYAFTYIDHKVIHRCHERFEEAMDIFFPCNTERHIIQKILKLKYRAPNGKMYWVGIALYQRPNNTVGAKYSIVHVALPMQKTIC